MITRNVEPLAGEMQLIREHVSKPAATKEEPTLKPHPHYIRYGANELGEISGIGWKLCMIIDKAVI